MARRFSAFRGLGVAAAEVVDVTLVVVLDATEVVFVADTVVVVELLPGVYQLLKLPLMVAPARTLATE